MRGAASRRQPSVCRALNKKKWQEKKKRNTHEIRVPNEKRRFVVKGDHFGTPRFPMRGVASTRRFLAFPSVPFISSINNGDDGTFLCVAAPRRS